MKHGYSAFRFDVSELRLLSHEVRGEVEYENFLFTHDPEAVLQRISAAPAELRRISADIYDRGLAVENLVHTLWRHQDENQKRLAMIDELKTRHDELESETRARSAALAENDQHLRKAVRDLTEQAAVIDQLRRDFQDAINGRDALETDLRASLNVVEQLQRDFKEAVLGRDTAEAAVKVLRQQQLLQAQGS